MKAVASSTSVPFHRNPSKNEFSRTKKKGRGRLQKQPRLAFALPVDPGYRLSIDSSHLEEKNGILTCSIIDLSIRETSLCPPFPAWPPVRPPKVPMLKETRSTRAGFKAVAAHLISVPRSGRWRLKSTSTSPRQQAMTRIHSGSRTGALSSRAHPRSLATIPSIDPCPDPTLGERRQSHRETRFFPDPGGHL